MKAPTKFLTVNAPIAATAVGLMYWLAVIAPHILGALLVGGTTLQILLGYYTLRKLDD